MILMDGHRDVVQHLHLEDLGIGGGTFGRTAIS